MIYENKEVLMSVKSLNKNYDVPVLKDISFEVRNISRPNMNQGQIVSLIGKSGSGKSTLFRIMAGLEKANSGEILIKPSKEGDMRQVKEGDCGVVFQNSYIYRWRKVNLILKMAASKNPLIQSNMREWISHYVTVLDLGDHLNKYPDKLSGGQRQRVAIAEQVLSGSNFILLDEPFSGLDTLSIDKVTSMLVKISEEDEYKTIIIVSHDLSNSLVISDSAFILSKNINGGSSILSQINLAELGFAWRPDIKEDLSFRSLLNDIKSKL